MLRSTGDLLATSAMQQPAPPGVARLALCDLVCALGTSRVALLALLKDAGMTRLADRQSVCNALSKAVRESRVAAEDEGCDDRSTAMSSSGRLPSPLAGASDDAPSVVRTQQGVVAAAACPRGLDAEFRRAHAALLECTPVPHRAAPDRCGCVVIGAGVAGVSAAIELSRSDADVVLLERASCAGGIWRDHANSYSRVNSSEPAYRICGGTPSTNHTPAHQILDSVAEAIRAHGLQERLCTSHTVTKVAPSPLGGDDAWRVEGLRCGDGGAFATECAFAVLCTNRRLGSPRDVSFEGEASFAGTIRRGTANDAARDRWGRTLIVGMGAYALEFLRTALERAAPRATILCRRRGVVCPQVVDWVNFVRPVREDFTKDAAGNAMVQLAWVKTYRLSRAKPPECWHERPRLLKPDGHTVSTSDLFFVAHHMEVAETLLGEVGRVVRDGVVTQGHGEAPHRTLPCEAIVKCVGFHENDANELILERRNFRGIGMVDRNLWFIAEPHLDAATFSLPFGSSYLNHAQFVAKVAARAREDASLSECLGQLPCDASVARFTTTDVFRSITAADARIRQMLHEHARAVSNRFEDAFAFGEYLDANEVAWKEYHHLLQSLQKATYDAYLPWCFRELEVMVALEREKAA